MKPRMNLGRIPATFRTSSGAKICGRCSHAHPESEYHKNARSKDGLTCYCKSCRAKYIQTWRREHPEKQKQYNKQYWPKYSDRARQRRLAMLSQNSEQSHG